MDLIVKMKFGSHLYGTATPDSDLDYKGIFLPTCEQILLGRIPKSINHSTKKGSEDKNTSEDVDTEIYSLHYFLKLACEGQTVALDMLHAPDNIIMEHSTIWNSLVNNRHLFYTKNLKAFVGYARRQAAKYGIKGSRLNDAGRVLEYLKAQDPDEKLYDIWDGLPAGDHIHHIGPDDNGIQQYQVCGKILQSTSRVGYVIPIIERFFQAYGERAKKAANNEGIDWKAVSHAVRAAYQVRELLRYRTITFPLRKAAQLRMIKEGRLDYLNQVAPLLESLMDQIEELAKVSTLPERVDRKYWDAWLVQTLDYYRFKNVPPCSC